MKANRSRMIFVNLAVRDLKRSVEFFSKQADPIDRGFIYGRSFYDLDGHHWEVLYVDPQALAQ